MFAGFPDALVPAPCVRNAALPREEKSLAPATTQKCLTFMEAVGAVRRLFGRRGRAARQDISATEDADGPLRSDEAREARAKYKKRKD